jgi:hypothetical protein
MSSSRPEDFAADTLDILQRKKVRFRGCKPESIEIFVDGAIKVWFMGYYPDGKLRRTGITLMDFSPIKQAIHMGNPEVIARLTEEVIDNNSARFF